MKVDDLASGLLEVYEAANKKWDEFSATVRTSVVLIAFLACLIITGKAFMFVAVMVFGVQRIMYLNGAFKDDSAELHPTNDEDPSNQGE